jgi:hypothetical protein
LVSYKSSCCDFKKVYPVITSSEKDLARAEAEDFRNAAAAAEIAVIAVRAERTEGGAAEEADDNDELFREFATGKVARPPAYVRFTRWMKKRLGIKRVRGFSLEIRYMYNVC